MGSLRPTRLDRAATAVVLTMLLGGVGTLGWLVGHVLTYDATGHEHAHATHEYMRPAEQGGLAIALVGVALALVAILVGRGAVARWVAAWRDSGSILPWIGAAVVPASTFVVVELLEGSIATRGLDLVAYGVPLQALIGIVVLSLVRSLLGVLVRVVDQIAGWLRTPAVRGQLRTPRPIVRIHPLRVAPMATNAALRAPPRLVP